MLSWFLESVWLIPLYPLVGTVVAALWFPGIIRRTGPRPAGYINALMTLVALGHTLLALVAMGGREPLSYSLPWLQVAGLDLSLPLVVSSVSLAAMAVIFGVNFLAQVYAFGYLEMDWGWARFFSLLAFFEVGMSALALCDSLFFSYMILEVLTLGTYLLVGFWFNQPLVVTGARDAFLTKRVGDLLLLMGVLSLWPLSHTWNFTELAQWATQPDTLAYAEAHPQVFFLLGLALLAGPLGKCAQFPFHLWLDEAMEGPLPATILRNAVVVLTGSWLQLVTDLAEQSPGLAAVVLLVNGLLTFGLVRVVCLIFGNRPQPMSERSPELHWPFILPMTVLAGVVLHVPHLLAVTGLLPAWQRDWGLLLTLSTLSGASLAALVYLSPGIPKPVRLPVASLQDLLAYDLYTPKIYRLTVVGLVDLVSRISDVLDRYLVDGLVNLVGVATVFGGETLKYSTSGKFQWYLFTILVGMALVVGLAVMTFLN